MARPKRKPYDPGKVYDRRASESNRGLQPHLDPIEVEDPMEQGSKLIVMRSTRDDPLAGLHARKRIDEAQYHAGRAFQKDFENAERGPRAIDPGKEAVDGGVTPEPITEAQQASAKRLGEIYRLLGQNGSALAHSILVHGYSIEATALMRMMVTEREIRFLGQRFKECLDDLAVFYGLATHSPG